MKRRTVLYVIGISSVAVFVAVSIVGFVLDVLTASVLGPILAVISLFGVSTVIAQDNLNLKCIKLCEEKKYAEERAVIEKHMKSPLFFLVRMVALQRYVRASMALDDLSTAKKYIEILRNGGGMGWKYKTAYCYILIKLDEGEFETARSEFEEFRRDCAHAEIYKTQLEILTAIFSRLFTARDTSPLPAFPVVSRILGRHYEAEVAARGEEWN